MAQLSIFDPTTLPEAHAHQIRSFIRMHWHDEYLYDLDAPCSRSSGIRGTQPKTWAMSAAELRKYGTALLGQSYICAFSMWRYSDSYYGRADVKSAMADLSALAKSHARTSCRQ